MFWPESDWKKKCYNYMTKNEFQLLIDSTSFTLPAVQKRAGIPLGSTEAELNAGGC